MTALRKENEKLQKENIRLNDSLKDKNLSPEMAELKRVTGELQQSFRQGEDMFAFIQASCPSLVKLRRKPVYLSHAEIQELRSLADAIFPKFGSLVKGKTLDLKESEVILCYLIKLHFSVSEIAIFLGIASTSVSTAKLRTKKKIYAALDISSSNEFIFWTILYCLFINLSLALPNMVFAIFPSILILPIFLFQLFYI